MSNVVPELESANNANAPVPIPEFVSRLLRRGDDVQRLPGDGTAILIRPAQRSGRFRELLHARIGRVLRPKRYADSSDWFVKAEIDGSTELRSLIVSADGLKRYFYAGSTEGGQATFYSSIGVSETASLAELRLAWRMKSVSTSLSGDARLKNQAERAFNILAHPDIRTNYDACLQDADAMLPFPYGGCGECVVTGRLSDDGATFFADSILAFKPRMQSKQVKVLLRQCEFLPDRVTLLDTRRKMEIWLDGGLLNGIVWDSTWNRWKQWLRSRLEVKATFVASSKYRFAKGEWTVAKWWTALPSRISVAIPQSINEDITRAQAIHELLGRHTDILNRLREQIARQPVEVSVVQSWLDGLRASPQFRPEYTTWQPDYEEYFFAELRKRAKTWFLFRDEYLFVLPDVVVSEIPKAGHASYLFAAPKDLESFLRLYGAASRSDIRQDRANVAIELGFIGRVVRGKKRKRWLAEMLRHAGDQANHLDAVEDSEGVSK